MDDLEGRKELLRISGLKEGKILDVGMGNCGCMALFLARRGLHVTGIDHSSLAVHKSRKEAKKFKLKGSFQARWAKAENIPFENDSFDAVFSYHSLHHMKAVHKVIREMVRVCKKGGLIVISDLNEKGRRDYKHGLDKKFLMNIEKQLRKYTKIVRKGKTKINTMFICKKEP
jgi:ubiquinone/menaquinone biosynthesis C-methylase UbiE